MHEIETLFVEEDDKVVNLLGVKGMGELGMVGIPAAIANAVFHATGKRVRACRLRRISCCRRSAAKNADSVCRSYRRLRCEW